MGGGGGRAYIVSVYNTTFYFIAKSLLSALYCHGYGKFGSGSGGGGGGGGGGGKLEMYCDSYSKFGQVLGGGGVPPLPNYGPDM